jgi:hypothetical protein
MMEYVSVLSGNTTFLTGADVIPFEDFISLAGITEGKLEEIGNNLRKIKSKRLRLVVIGFGGAMVNSLYFMNKFSEMSSLSDIFGALYIYEDDMLDITNAPRIYPDLSKIHHSNSKPKCKLDMIYSLLPALRDYPSPYDMRFRERNVLEHGNGSIYLGAPDFATRKILEDKNFLFLGHAGNELQIFKTPIVDATMTTETYGSIDTTVFFYNMLLGTIELIDILANQDISQIPDDSVLSTINFAETVKGAQNVLV